MKKEKWMEFEWPGVHWYQVIHPLSTWTNDFGKYGTPLSKMAAAYFKGTSGYYVIKEEYEQSGKKYFARIEKEPKIMFDILIRVEEAASEIFRVGRKWQDLDLRKLSDKKLISMHKELFSWDKQLWQKGQIQNLLELHNSYLSQYVKKLISRKFGENKVNEIFKVLTTPTYYSITERQDEDFVKLFKIANKNALYNHWHKYTWMIYSWAGPALSYEYFAETITQAKKNPKIIKEINLRIKEKQRLLRSQKFVLSKFHGLDKQLIVLLRTILESKALRVDAHSMTYFTAERFMNEIGRRLGLSLNQLRVVEPSHVPELFKGYDVDKINDEYNLVLYWYQGPKLIKLTGKAAKKKLAYIKSRLPKIKPVKELKGELAYAGKVRGKVRLILDIKDATKFKQGEILVSRITDPSYVPLMKKAKAIVTDVGGITSHAAIVSRELHKVCIVGTNIGTKVLKDGDLVEVDAERGVVKKISN